MSVIFTLSIRVIRMKLANFIKFADYYKTEHYKQLVKDFQEFDLACERGEVKSGGYCLSCRETGCGHYLDNIGGVISKEAHMRLNRS